MRLLRSRDCETEVGEHHLAERVDEDIRALEIRVDEALAETSRNVCRSQYKYASFSRLALSEIAACLPICCTVPLSSWHIPLEGDEPVQDVPQNEGDLRRLQLEFQESVLEAAGIHEGQDDTHLRSISADLYEFDDVLKSLKMSELG